MGKTLKGAAKTASKIATKVKRAKGKIARKCGKATACAVGAFLLLCVGCSTARSEMPAEQSSAQRAQTITAMFRDCQFNFGYSAATNYTGNLPSFEFITATQSNETGGGETYENAPTATPTATQTPTNTTEVPITVKYNDALAAATPASMSVIGAIGQGVDGVLSLMQSRKSGTVQVTKTDGTKACVSCSDGQCSFCTDGACAPK